MFLVLKLLKNSKKKFFFDGLSEKSCFLWTLYDDVPDIFIFE